MFLHMHLKNIRNIIGISGIEKIRDAQPVPRTCTFEAWLNEINYLDDSGDQGGNYVEIGGLAGTDLTGWQLVFYKQGNPFSPGSGSEFF